MSKRSQQIAALFQQAQRLHVSGRLAEAERVYRQIIAASPRQPEALHALAALALQTGRADMAEALVDQAIALKPAAKFYLTRTHILLALRRPNQAEQAARLVLRAQPASAEAYQALGHALIDGGDPAAAIEAYQQGVRLNPALPDIHNNLGTALRQAHRLEEAEHSFSRLRLRWRP